MNELFIDILEVGNETFKHTICFYISNATCRWVKIKKYLFPKKIMDFRTQKMSKNGLPNIFRLRGPDKFKMSEKL